MSAHEEREGACTPLRPKSMGVHAGQTSGLQPARRTILCVYPTTLQGRGVAGRRPRSRGGKVLNRREDWGDWAVNRRPTPQPESRNPTTALHLLGATIRQYRRYRGLTQRALAERTG